jgi:hypothetical protein
MIGGWLHLRFLVDDATSTYIGPVFFLDQLTSFLEKQLPTILVCIDKNHMCLKCQSIKVYGYYNWIIK